MSQNWKTYKLGSLLKEKGYIRGPFGSALKRGEMTAIGVPVYEQQQAIYNTRDFRFFIGPEKFEKLKRFQVKTNDLIISCSGTVGRVSIINENDPKGIISQALLILRPDEIKVLPFYLKKFFESPEGFNKLLGASYGSVQANIANRNIVENIVLSLPPLPEQTAIASILSALDDKIELNLQMNKTLEEMAMALYKHWFVDFGPFKDGEFVESELGMIPKGWEVKKLGEFSTIIMGQSPKSEFYNDERKGLPFHQGVKDFGIRFPTDITFSTSGNKIAEKGDILFSVRAPVGRINIAKNKLVLGRGLASIKMKEGNGFLLYALKNFFQKEDIIGSGTVFNSVNKTEIENIKFVMPEINKFMEFNEKVLQLDEMIYSNFLEIENLKNQRDSLLPKLISGEIQVKDLEKN